MGTVSTAYYQPNLKGVGTAQSHVKALPLKPLSFHLHLAPASRSYSLLNRGEMGR